MPEPDNRGPGERMWDAALEAAMNYDRQCPLKYKCLKCNQLFRHLNVEWKAEYDGGRAWPYEMSPCCRWHYEDL